MPLWQGIYKIHYEITGDGPNTVLCLPGYLGTLELDYGKIFEVIDKSKFKVVSWDPPGYGFSRPPDRDFTRGYLQRDAETVAELMENLGFERYSVLGWSQGGITGILLAAKYPSRVISLATIGSGTKFDSKMTQFYESMALCETIDMISLWPPEKVQSQQKYYKKHYLQEMTNNMVDYSRQAQQKQLDETKEACSRLTCPTLIMHAENDRAFPVRHASVLHGRIKGSKLHIFPQGGHDVHLTHTKEFMTVWTSFVLEFGA